MTGQGRRDSADGTGQTGQRRRDRLLTGQTGHLRALKNDGMGIRIVTMKKKLFFYLIHFDQLIRNSTR